MYGSDAVTKHVYNTLRERAAIKAVIGDPARIYDEPIAPEGSEFPYCLHYDDDASYAQDPIVTGQLPYAQKISYVVLFITKGVSLAPLRPARKDAFEALVVQEASADVTIEDITYHLDIGAARQWPKARSTDVLGGERYRRLGFVLTVDVFRV